MQPGLKRAGAAGAAECLPRESMLALSVAHMAELATREGGATIADSARSFTRVALAGGSPLAGPWRVQTSVFSDLPIARLGQNQPALLGGGCSSCAASRDGHRGTA